MSAKVSATTEASQSPSGSSRKEVPVLQASRESGASCFDIGKRRSPLAGGDSRSVGKHSDLDSGHDVSFNTHSTSIQTSSSFSSQSSEETCEVARENVPQPEKIHQQSPLTQHKNPPNEHDDKRAALLPLKTVSDTGDVVQRRRNSLMRSDVRRSVSKSSSPEGSQPLSERYSPVSDSFYSIKNNNTNPISCSHSRFSRLYKQEPLQEDKILGFSIDSTKVIRVNTPPRSILRRPGIRPRKKPYRISFASTGDKVIEEKDVYDEESDYDPSEPSISYSAVEAIQELEQHHLQEELSPEWLSGESLSQGHPHNDMQHNGRSSILRSVPDSGVNNRDTPQRQLRETTGLLPREDRAARQRNDYDNESDEAVVMQSHVEWSDTTTQKLLAKGRPGPQTHPRWSADSDPPPDVVWIRKHRETIIPDEDSGSEGSPTREALHLPQQQQKGNSRSSRTYHPQASSGFQYPSNSLKSPSQFEAIITQVRSVDSEDEESFYSGSDSTSGNSPILVSSPNKHLDASFEQRDGSDAAALLTHREHAQHPQKGASSDVSSIHSQLDGMECAVAQNTNRSRSTGTPAANAVGEHSDSGKAEFEISSKYKGHVPVKAQQDHKNVIPFALQESHESPNEADVLREIREVSSMSEVTWTVPLTHRSQPPQKASYAPCSEDKRENNLPPAGLESEPGKSVSTHPHPSEHSHHSAKFIPRSESGAPGDFSTSYPESRLTAAHRNSTELKRTASELTRPKSNQDFASALPHRQEEKNACSPGGSSRELRKDGHPLSPPNAMRANSWQKEATEQKPAATPREDNKAHEVDVLMHPTVPIPEPPNAQSHDVLSEPKKVVQRNLILVTRRKRKSSGVSDNNSIVRMSVIPLQQDGAGQKYEQGRILKRLFGRYVDHSTSRSSSNHLRRTTDGKVMRKRRKQNSQEAIKDASQKEKHFSPELADASLRPSSDHSSTSSHRMGGTGLSEYDETKHYTEAIGKEKNSLSMGQGQFLDQGKSDPKRNSEKGHTRRKTSLSAVKGSSLACAGHNLSPATSDILNENDCMSIIKDESSSTQQERQILTLQSESESTQVLQKRRRRVLAAVLPKSNPSDIRHSSPEAGEMDHNTLGVPHTSTHASSKVSKRRKASAVKSFASSENATTRNALQVPNKSSEETHSVDATEYASMPIWIAKPAIHLVHLPTGEVTTTDKPISLLFSRSHADSGEAEKGVLSITKGHVSDRDAQSFSQVALSSGGPYSLMQTQKKMLNKEVLTEICTTFDSVQSADEMYDHSFKKTLTRVHDHGNSEMLSAHQPNKEEIQSTQHCNPNQSGPARDKIGDNEGEGGVGHGGVHLSTGSELCDRVQGEGYNKPHGNSSDLCGTGITLQLQKEADPTEGRSIHSGVQETPQKENKQSNSFLNLPLHGSSHLSKDHAAVQTPSTRESSPRRHSTVPETQPPSKLVQTPPGEKPSRRHRHHHHRQHLQDIHSEDQTFKRILTKKRKSQSPDSHLAQDRKADGVTSESLQKEDLVTSLEYQLGIIMEKKHRKEKRRSKKKQKRQKEIEKEMEKFFPQSKEDVGARVSDTIPSNWSKRESSTQNRASYTEPRFDTSQVAEHDDHVEQNNQLPVRPKETQSLLSQVTEVHRGIHRNQADVARRSFGSNECAPAAPFSSQPTVWEDYKRAASQSWKLSDSNSRPFEWYGNFSGHSQNMNLSSDTLGYLKGTYDRHKDGKDVRGNLRNESFSSHNRSVGCFSADGKTPPDRYNYNADVDSPPSLMHKELVDTPPRGSHVNAIMSRYKYHEKNRTLGSVSERDWLMERCPPPSIVNKMDEYVTDGNPQIAEYIVKDRLATREFVYAMRRVVDGLNLYKALA